MLKHAVFRNDPYQFQNKAKQLVRHFPAADCFPEMFSKKLHVKYGACKSV